MRKIFIAVILLIFITNICPGAEFTSGGFYKKVNIWHDFSSKQFLFCRIDSNRVSNVEESEITAEYDEDSSVLADEDIQRIVRFVNRFSEISNEFQLIAHADSCGSDEYNMNLSKRRGHNVVDEILKLSKIKKGTKINMSFIGEHEAQGHHRHDRYVKISTSHPPGLQQKFKDIVLIDGSGSLENSPTQSGYRFFCKRNQYNCPRLTDLKFRPETLVYVIREKKYGCSGTNLKRYRPSGKTFISSAQAIIANYVNGPVRVHTYSDGDPQNDEGLTPRQKQNLYKIRQSANDELGVTWYYR